MLNDSSVAKLLTIVTKLTEKVRSAKYIVSIEIIDSQIIVTYSDDTQVNIPLPKIAKVSSTIDILQIEQSIKAALQTNIDTELSVIKQAMLEAIPKPIAGEKGGDGKDADEQKIIDAVIESLQEKIKELIPTPANGEDGKDADEELIKSSLLESINAELSTIKTSLDNELKESIQLIKESISTVKNGEDSKDADEQAMTNTLTEKLQSLVEESNKSMQAELLDRITQEIKEIQDGFKPEKGGAGQNGIDGKDADETKITNAILSKVNVELSKSKQVIKSEIKHGLEIIKQSIPEPIKGDKGDSVKGDKGDKGDSIKGDKGDAGDRGNGVIDAKIDRRGHLIVKTDDSTIDAGKVENKQYFGGFSFDYTNALPMPFDVGGLKAGTKFKGVDLKVLWTKLLYGYDLPFFNAFTIAGLPETVEVGYTLAAGDYEATFEITNPELLNTDSIVISQNGAMLLDSLPNLSPVTISLEEQTAITPQSTSFEIFAYDTTGTSFSKSLSMKYQYRIYYGEYLEDITDNVNAGDVMTSFPLRASALVDTIVGEYHFLDLEYKWFCYPEVLGEHYTLYDLASDIALVLDDVRKIEITNEFGVKIMYNCYRTYNTMATEFTMGIK